MKLTALYECLKDPTRLRLLHALAEGPLCVCHLQEVLDEPQTKVSKHLAYLKSHGAVVSRRNGAWVIYAVPEAPHPALRANLDCLLAERKDPLFRDDARRLAAVRKRFADGTPSCASAADAL